MPIPVPPRPPATPGVPPSGVPAQPAVSVSPYTAREHQGWAIRQEIERHNGAMFQVGEWVIFLLLWCDIDFERGLVGRCQVCFSSGSDLDDRISAVYKQPTKQRCPDCLGTTFEGGYRARLVRPAILSDTDESQRLQKRGVNHPAQKNVETTIDFRARNGDWMISADNSRWQLSVPRRTTVRTGFEHPDQGSTGVSYSGITAKMEEPGSVAYDAYPQHQAAVRAVLSQPIVFPYDFSAFEQINGPLLPPAFLD